LIVGVAVLIDAVGFLITVTVAVSVTVTPPEVAVNVYMVVSVNIPVDIDPIGLTTAPMPLSMLNDRALVDVQSNVDELSSYIVTGSALTATVTGLASAVTVTVAVSVLDPTTFVAVIVYVVCAARTAVVTEPLSVAGSTGLAGSGSGVMLILVASVDDHESVVDVPEVMVAGFAVMVTVGRLFTVMVALASALPEALVAFSVYVVVTLGLTERLSFKATAPMP